MPRYRLRTLMIVLALAPAILWALTVWLANILDRFQPPYKAAEPAQSQSTPTSRGKPPNSGRDASSQWPVWATSDV